MAISREVDRLPLLGARAVVPKPQPVVLVGATAGYKVVETGGETSAGERKRHGWVENGRQRGCDVGARDWLRSGTGLRRSGGARWYEVKRVEDVRLGGKDGGGVG